MKITLTEITAVNRFFSSPKTRKFLNTPISELSKIKSLSNNRTAVKTILESQTGRNILFLDSRSNKIMSRRQFVNKIKTGRYTNYHIRKINNIDTPVSNPDSYTSNNLG